MKIECNSAFCNQRIQRHYKSRVPLLKGHKFQEKMDNVGSYIFQSLANEVQVIKSSALGRQDRGRCKELWVEKS